MFFQKPGSVSAWKLWTALNVTTKQICVLIHQSPQQETTKMPQNIINEPKISSKWKSYRLSASQTLYCNAQTKKGKQVLCLSARWWHPCPQKQMAHWRCPVFFISCGARVQFLYEWSQYIFLPMVSQYSSDPQVVIMWQICISKSRQEEEVNMHVNKQGQKCSKKMCFWSKWTKSVGYNNYYEADYLFLIIFCDSRRRKFQLWIEFPKKMMMVRGCLSGLWGRTLGKQLLVFKKARLEITEFQIKTGSSNQTTSHFEIWGLKSSRICIQLCFSTLKTVALPQSDGVFARFWKTSLDKTSDLSKFKLLWWIMKTEQVFPLKEMHFLSRKHNMIS